MLSRVANSLFWLARYLERSENTARYLTVTHAYGQELRGVIHGADADCLAVTRDLFTAPDEPAGMGRGILRRFGLDPALPNSVVSSLTHARENARGIRDAISSEMWEELNVMHLVLQEAVASSSVESMDFDTLIRVRSTSHLFQGLRDNTLVRGDAWHFLLLGQFLERADWTARVLRAMWSHPAVLKAAEAGHNIETMHLVATLRCCTAFEAFRRFDRSLAADRVLHFLVLEAGFPRSVEFCLQEVSRSLHVLSGTPLEVFTNEAEQSSGRLLSELRFTSVEELLQGDVAEFLTGILARIDGVAAAVVRLYFP